MSPRTHDVAIVGGGLAGLTAAIDLAQKGHDVVVLERKSYPRHKVCGEYVSNEIRPYFQRLGISLSEWPVSPVDRFRLHAPSGSWVESALPLGGFGLRRYALDGKLYQFALQSGVTVHLETAVSEARHGDMATTLTSRKGSSWKARVVLGAHGRHAPLDHRLDRAFVREKSGLFAGKFYVKGEFPADLVALFAFPGGYAGAVRVEDGTVDVAYLVRQDDLQSAGGVSQLESQLLRRNPALNELLQKSRRVPDSDLSIANVSLRPKEPVVQHILMIGDAAGMIPPVCGNGMAMAVHAAKLAAESADRFLRGVTLRPEMESQFAQSWKKELGSRLSWGRVLHPVLCRSFSSEAAIAGLRRVPNLLTPIIRRTHGNEIA